MRGINPGGKIFLMADNIHVDENVYWGSLTLDSERDPDSRIMIDQIR
jgi:hypothetical protein